MVICGGNLPEMLRLWNILLPGVGLIHRRRCAVGGLVAGGYLLMLAIAVAGIWLGESTIPHWATVSAAAGAGGLFAVGQIALGRHLAGRHDPAWRLHIAALRETSEAHLDHGRHIDALLTVEEWLAEDPVSAEAYLLRGHVYAETGRPERARQAYKRAGKLDTTGKFAEEIRESVAALGVRL